MSNFYLNDSGSNTWQVVVSDAGLLDQIPVSSETPSASTLNDIATNTATWTIGVDTSGELTATNDTYSSGNPTSIPLTSPGGYSFIIIVLANGDIDTRALGPSGQNLIITWLRRTRIGGDGWGEGPTIPLSEDSELYDLEILGTDGVTVIRTISGLTTPTYVYTEALMMEDFGFVPGSVAVNVYQISGEVGRGFKGHGVAPSSTYVPPTYPAAGGFYVNGS